MRPASFFAPRIVALAAAMAIHTPTTLDVIVDTSTAIPGRNKPFAQFRAVALDGETVTFHGSGFPGPEGIYRFEAGRLSTVVDSETPIPGLPLVTTLFPGDPSVGQGRGQGEIAFVGAYDEIAFVLIDSGGLRVAAQPGDPIPDVPGAFLQDFFTCSLDGGSVGFTAFAAGGGLPPSLGIYSTANGLHTIANVDTPVPGGDGAFTSFGFNPTFDAGAAAFCGGGSAGDGVFRGDGSLALVADTNTPIPGGSGTFTRFLDGPTIRGDEVAFRALGSGGQKGIWTSRDELVLVADASTPIPGGTGTFVGFNEASHHGPALNGAGSVAFLGEGAGNRRGIYVARSGGLVKVVATGDLVGGRTVSWLDLGREGFDRRRLAFVAGFTDGSSAVVVASMAR